MINLLFLKYTPNYFLLTHTSSNLNINKKVYVLLVSNIKKKISINLFTFNKTVPKNVEFVFFFLHENKKLNALNSSLINIKIDNFVYN